VVAIAFCLSVMVAALRRVSINLGVLSYNAGEETRAVAYRVQSVSVTSRLTNGCGWTVEGGAIGGKPLSKNWPFAIRNIGWNEWRDRSGGGWRKNDDGGGS
jgi:hypothetical protein